MIVTSMVRRIQDKNPRDARLLLRIWLNRIYHLPRYFERPRLDMHGVIFYGKGKRLRTSQWFVKLQRRSSILRIVCLRKNGDGAALKSLKNTMTSEKKSAIKLKQHGKEGSYKTVYPSGGKKHINVTTEESCDQKALHNINLLQSLAPLHTVAHHRGKKTVNKRHYTTKSLHGLLHNTTR
ncbi:hypothetical protein ACFX2K_014913 [Malus domestica]